jgi:mRNA interferase HigB
VRVFNASTINRLCEEHTDAANTLRLWFQWAKEGQWSSPAELSRDLYQPSPVGPSRIVFNIGRQYRLICNVDYTRGGAIFLKWFGSHAEYDRIDAETADNLT